MYRDFYSHTHPDIIRDIYISIIHTHLEHARARFATDFACNTFENSDVFQLARVSNCDFMHYGNVVLPLEMAP